MATLTRSANILTTAQLAEATAGGDDYIRTRNNVPCGLALRLDFNPEAPDVIMFGPGPRVEARAQRLLEHGLAVPAYVKRGTNAWEYMGEYRATALRTDKATLKRYGHGRRVGEVVGALFLEPVAEPKVQVSGGGFADAQTRKEIEIAAVAHVTRELEARGFEVHDRQRENRGYDLLAVSPDARILVEVKGTDSPVPRFFLTRNEARCSDAEADWRLFVVCSARQMPVTHEYSATEMHEQFLLDPLAWGCTPRTLQSRELLRAPT